MLICPGSCFGRCRECSRDCDGDDVSERYENGAGERVGEVMTAAAALTERFVRCVALPAMASSVGTARMHTRDVLRDWELGAMADDAELVVSELVTNAIRASNAVPEQASYPELYDRLEVVCLCLWLFEAELLIEVWDRRRSLPSRRESTLDEEGGRGLFLVESLCGQWGTRSTVEGKVVWATMATERTPRPYAE